MTGFVNQDERYAWGTLTWDIRSINHRYLEMNLRLPEVFRPLEAEVRELIKKRITRGKLDVSLKWQPSSEVVPSYLVNQATLKAVAQSIEQVQNLFPKAQLSATDLLRWQGVLQKEERDVSEYSAPLLSLLDRALTGLLTSRQTEGAAIGECLSDLLKQIAAHRDFICAKMPTLQVEQRQRILKRAKELKVELDSQRLEQELVFMLNKQDVAEEMQRLAAHIEEAQNILNRGGVIGRRLDFLMQEFNREANTTASKSVDTEVTQAVVDMKVCIEQIREQVQNIE